MPKDPLRKCVIALTGDFDIDGNHKKMRQWIERNGGQYAAEIEDGVTHLVCSEDHFKRKTAIVITALKIKGLKIVSYDWLEDTLHKQARKNEIPYMLKNLEAKNKKKVSQKRGSQKVKTENLLVGLDNFEAGCQMERDRMTLNDYHIYRDPKSGFAYDVTLVRENMLERKDSTEKWSLKVGRILNPLWPTVAGPRNTRSPLDKPRAQCLQLYEANDMKLAQYATYATYSQPYGHSTHVLAPMGSSFSLATDQFGAFFKLKTKLEWHERNGEEAPIGGGFYYVPKLRTFAKDSKADGGDGDEEREEAEEEQKEEAGEKQQGEAEEEQQEEVGKNESPFNEMIYG